MPCYFGNCLINSDVNKGKVAVNIRDCRDIQMDCLLRYQRGVHQGMAAFWINDSNVIASIRRLYHVVQAGGEMRSVAHKLGEFSFFKL